MEPMQPLCVASELIREESGLQIVRLADIGKSVACVTHEIRNSLQRIVIEMDELRLKLGGNTECMEILESIGRNVDGMTNFARDLLHYAKPLHLTYSPCSTGEVANAAIGLVAHKLKDITIIVDDEEEERKVLMDHDRIVQVFVNIISNAADAMPEGGELMIAAQYHWQGDGEVLRICITDSGCGMDQRDVEMLQQPFVTSKTNGTGLGIPISKSIILAHNGSFEIRSIRDVGTTVEITLPVEI